MITASFWYLPSLLWQKSHILGIVPIPGANPRADTDLDTLAGDVGQAVDHLGQDVIQDRVAGIVTALVDSGIGDIYNRVLCPTCIAQILIINTMTVSCQFSLIRLIISIINRFISVVVIIC